jgi:hypothetical protein
MMRSDTMAKVIAVVRLAPGQVAFYDEKTGMHLTMGNPMKDVLDYMDTTRIKRAVKNKVLTLVHGGFADIIDEPEIKEVHIEVNPIETNTDSNKEKVDVVDKVEDVKIEVPKEELETETPIEESTEELTDETVTEESETVTESAEEKPKSKRKKKED